MQRLVVESGAWVTEEKVFKSEVLQNNYKEFHSYVSGIPKLKCQKCGLLKII